MKRMVVVATWALATFLYTLCAADAAPEQPAATATPSAAVSEQTPATGPSGEFYIIGDVRHSGVYSFSGRPVTVKMALLATGIEEGKEWPEKIALIRRGPTQEEWVPLRPKSILSGEDADVALMPNDVMAVVAGEQIAQRQQPIQPAPTSLPAARTEPAMSLVYVRGEVLRPGVYSVFGRRVTIKQVLAAAGTRAWEWPETAVLIRTSKDSRDEWIPVKVKDLVMGRQADLFLQPQDLIVVGMDRHLSGSAATTTAASRPTSTGN